MESQTVFQEKTQAKNCLLNRLPGSARSVEALETALEVCRAQLAEMEAAGKGGGIVKSAPMSEQGRNSIEFFFCLSFAFKKTALIPFSTSTPSQNSSDFSSQNLNQICFY